MSLLSLHALALATAVAGGGSSTRLIDLGNTYPVALNEAGMIVLQSRDTGATFVWQGGLAYPVPTGDSDRPRAINDLGEVAGTFDQRTTIFKPCPGYRVNHNYIRLDIGQTVNGQTLNDCADINNRSDVVGRDLALGRAVVWTRANGPVHIWTGGPSSVNEGGDVAGAENAGSSGVFGRARYADGTNLTFGAHPTAAYSINDRREIVGVTGIGANPLVWRGFHLKDGVFRLLAPLSGQDQSYATRINNRGDAVGASGLNGRYSAVTWDRTGVVGPVPGLPPYLQSEALGVNDFGQIAGWGQISATEGEGWLRTPESSPEVVFRLYHPGTLEHLLTTSRSEYDFLGSVGWTQEGRVFATLDGPGPHDDAFPIPLYRLYHSGSRQHLYTTDPAEAVFLRDLRTWTYEGIMGFVFPSPVDGSMPLHRLVHANPPLHHWSADAAEVQGLVALGWVDEGIVGHVLHESEGLERDDSGEEGFGERSMEMVDAGLRYRGLLSASEEP